MNKRMKLYPWIPLFGFYAVYKYKESYKSISDFGGMFGYFGSMLFQGVSSGIIIGYVYHIVKY